MSQVRVHIEHARKLIQLSTGEWDSIKNQDHTIVWWRFFTVKSIRTWRAQNMQNYFYILQCLTQIQYLFWMVPVQLQQKRCKTLQDQGEGDQSCLHLAALSRHWFPQDLEPEWFGPLKSSDLWFWSHLGRLAWVLTAGVGVPQECPEDTTLSCWEDWWGALGRGWRLDSLEHQLLRVTEVCVLGWSFLF